MLKHEQYEELCTLAIIGEVSPAEIEDLRHHLQGCSQCREHYREFTEFLLPQLSLASESERPGSDDCTEAKRDQLRTDFLARAQEKGFEFSRQAMRGQNETAAVESASDSRRSNRWSLAVWQLALGASVACLVFAGGYFTHREINESRSAIEAKATPPVATPQSSEPHPVTAPAIPVNNRDAKTIAELEQKLAETTAELADTRKAVEENQTSQASLRGELEAKNKQISSLNSQLQGDAQTTAELRTQAADLRRRIEESQSTAAAGELHIRDLNEQLSSQTASLDREREMLSVGRDVRDLMGARSLHIIDVHDANGAGKNQKSFGRIFYTEGKSLIFYAFDLDDKRVVDAKYSYEAWGERLGQPASVKSLGVLYVDDKAQRRWSLKVDDPRQLSEINSVFVTLEPRSGEGDKPRGKRILFAFLGGEANHP